jgi:hypothetical protein
MRRASLYFGLAVFGFIVPFENAQAFGDRCFYPPHSVRGSTQASMSAARGAAIAQWERSAARKYGRAYANWWYSGDREISCSWDASGRRITCAAIAVACGRSR